ncbi:hypothetical protein V5O48_013442 [Marasmius crinis-equi]|uniref:CxC2-like cysteine cluster KDZ transposase-associated domain-containing protein n=1 Tax=Marasmius crinis-equi TaxID=585013 RepID=A0ABR3F030_9AGAR
MAPIRTSKPSSKNGFISVPSISTDGRRMKERLIPIALPDELPAVEHETTFPSLGGIQLEPLDLLPMDADFPVPSFREDLEQEIEEEELDEKITEEGMENEIQVGAATMHKTKEDSLWQMKAHSRDFLQIMMELEGRCESGDACGSCGCNSEVSFRCRSCTGNVMFCKKCLLVNHRSLPTHYVEQWNGFHFQRVGLRELGLRVQLGHPPTQTCRNPRPARIRFCVMDIDSIQEIELDFCQCQAVKVVGNAWTQLLHARLFPATVVDPRTAFTFRMLKFFHVATLQSKMTLYDVCRTLERRTDGSGISEPKNHYHELLRVMKMWRYLKQLKRGGIGCQPDWSLADVKPGELTIRCPGCPQPKVNLPTNWQSAANSYIYRKFIAVDACFRLKRRTVSSEAKDPGLMTGQAYYVEDVGCEHSLAAVDQASTKFSKGYATTGVVLCLCARHEIVEPNGVVDTNKGEKYWHTDYAISSSQKHFDPDLDYVLSYDINCRYSKQFFTRLEEDLPQDVKFECRKQNWHFVIPKLHIQGHGRPCQEIYSFYLLPGAGETDGEGIERHWADLGALASCTVEMGPGGRRDTIDDHIASSNWTKVITIGSVLRTRQRRAQEQAEAHQAIFVQFTETQVEHWPQWAKQVLEWEQKQSDFNPYSAGNIQGETEALVRLQLAKEESEQARAGQPSVHDVSPSAFMHAVLDLEELQRKLRLDLKDSKWRTETQQTELLERRAKISRQIARVRALQRIYTPVALEAFPPAPQPASLPEAEEVTTLLPSTLPPQHSSSSGPMQRSLQVRHQQASVRARQVLTRIERKLLEAKEKYRAAWKALEVLLGSGNVPFHCLEDRDCAAFNDPSNDPLKKKRNCRKQRDSNPLFQPRESRKPLSWIWTGVDVGEDSPAMQDALRIEWCKAQRWNEELELLEEEMQRVPISLEDEARQWLARIPSDSRALEAEGIAAYCCRQAGIRRGLSAFF